MFAGFSVVGQPHVMVRFMALDDTKNLVRTRCWYYGYFTLFYGLATVAGLTSRLYLPDLAALDPELALPTMAIELLSWFREHALWNALDEFLAKHQAALQTKRPLYHAALARARQGKEDESEERSRFVLGGVLQGRKALGKHGLEPCENRNGMCG